MSTKNFYKKTFDKYTLNQYSVYMKIKNIQKANVSFESFIKDLREIHADALHSGEEFAEIAVLSLLEEAVKIRPQLRRILEAGVKMEYDKEITELS